MIAARGQRRHGSAGTASGRGESQVMRKRLLLGLKLVVTGVFCAWIVAYVDWGQFWSTLLASKLWAIGLVLLMRFAGLAVSAFKWQQLLAIHSTAYRFGQLIRWYLTALFLNYFLPTSIGGDGYRIYKTLNNERGKSLAVLAVFVERVTGLAALLLLGYGAAIVTYRRQGDAIAGALVTAGTIGLLTGAVALWAVIHFRLLQRLARTKFWPKPLTTLLNLTGDYRHHPRRTVLVGLISFVFHVNKICVIWLLLYALGTTASAFELTVAVVAADVIGLLPISLGGLGLVDGSFIYVMGHYGVSHETGLATMLLMRTLLVPLSLTGAYFYFLGDPTARAVESEGGSFAPGHYVHTEAK